MYYIWAVVLTDVLKTGQMFLLDDYFHIRISLRGYLTGKSFYFLALKPIYPPSTKQYDECRDVAPPPPPLRLGDRWVLF